MFDMVDRNRRPKNVTLDPEVERDTLDWIEFRKPERITFSNVVDIALREYLDKRNFPLSKKTKAKTKDK